MTVRHYDLLGIGFGPSNIALAIAIEECELPIKAHFLEASNRPCWQPGMLLDGSDTQHNPLRDLVTPRNPRSRYTFVNYLKEAGRLFDYLNLGVTYPLRKEYAKYVIWVAAQFSEMVSYGTRAQKISFDSASGKWLVATATELFSADALVLGTGREKNIPSVFCDVLGERVFHLTSYLESIRALAPSIRSVAVVGASQSAVEINLDLMQRFPTIRIHAIHRSFSMRLKDTSPFSDHVYFPQFTDYFHAADRAAREDLATQLRPTNYSSVDMDVLHRLYMNCYEERLDGSSRFELHNNTVIDRADLVGDKVLLGIRERHLGRSTLIEVDAVVLATGFLDISAGGGLVKSIPLVSTIIDEILLDEKGEPVIDRSYGVRCRSGQLLFLNGLCESSHGLGDAGSFSLVSLRSEEILRAASRHLLKRRASSIAVAANPANPQLSMAKASEM